MMSPPTRAPFDPSPAASSEAVRDRMRRQRRRDTACEVRVRSILWRLGARFRVDARPVPSVPRRADVVFTRARVAVFIDGCFWHGCRKHKDLPAANRDWWARKIQRNVARDEDTTRRLRAAGWTVLRVWEHEAPEAVARRVLLRSTSARRERRDSALKRRTKT